MRCYLVLVSSLIFQAMAAQKSVPTDNKLANQVDSAVHLAAMAYMQDSRAHGLSIGIYRNEKRYTYNYGETRNGSGLLPTAENIYNLGSVAKTFVATMLAEAVVERRVSLDDDIRTYLPGNYPNLVYQGRPIRLVNLANHTSGIPRSLKTFPPQVMDSLTRLSMADQIHFLSLYDQDSLLSDLHHIRLDTLPGSRYRYSGDGMMILMLLLERIFHQSYETLVTHYLQTNLGMFETKTMLSPSDVKKMPQGYDENDQPQQYANFRGFIGGPSMNSTVNDMLTYIEANLSEKDSAIRLAHQLTWGNPGGFGVGLGWMMDTEEGVRYLYHDGHTKTGYNALCLFYPHKNYGMIILVNDNISQRKVGDIENNITKELLHR